MAITTLRGATSAVLKDLLKEQADDFPAGRHVRQALSARGKLLGPEEGFIWGLLPLLVCEAAGGDPRQGLHLGAAFDCFIAAADVFDDVQDDDDDDGLQRAAGPATAINVAAFLLFLSQAAVGRLARQGIPHSTVTELLELFAATGMKAYGGQQLDIDLTFVEGVTETRYLEMVERKSGTLVAGGCRAGALLAAADDQAIAAYAQFGRNLGVALQIANDTAGAAAISLEHSDLRTGKPTLPLIYAMEHAPEATRGALAEILRLARDGMLQPTDLERASDLLRTVGALEYAAVCADVYWEHALTCLRQAGCEDDSSLFDFLKHLRGD